MKQTVTMLAGRASPVISLHDAKKWVRRRDGFEDDVLLSLVEAATDHVGLEIRRLLGRQTWRVAASNFYQLSPVPIFPVSAIAALRFRGADGSYSDAPSAQLAAIEIRTSADIAYLCASSSDMIPTPLVNHAEAIEVDLTVGLEVLPKTLETAIKLMVAHLFTNREAVGSGSLSELPLSAKALCAPYRRFV